MTLRLARDLPEKPYNTTIQRFASKQWTIDYNALMVATIVQINERGFKIPAQWRTNADFMGVRWISDDTFNHEYFRYAVDNTYRDTILAFRSNPSEPGKFTATITNGDVPLTYRLAPYGLNPETNEYECLDTEYGTGRTFPADIIVPESEWTPIPDEEMEAYKGRKDYIFVLDFDDMRMLSRFNGPRISPEDVSSISFDIVEWSHGLGKDATVQSMEQIGDRVKVRITGAIPGSVLSKGDKLSVLGQFKTVGHRTMGMGSTNWLLDNLLWSLARYGSPPATGYQTLPPAEVRRWPMRVPHEFYRNPELIPLSEDVKAWIGVRGYYRYNADFGGPFLEDWKVDWTEGPMEVTKLEMLPLYVYQGRPFMQLYVTFKTEGIAAQRMGGRERVNHNTIRFQEVDWVDLIYPVYETTVHEMQFEVDEWSGFGTGEVTVWFTGKIPGEFLECDTFYSRYLKVTSPAEVTDSTKYFVDMTTTGSRTTLAARHYPQPAHDLMMTSGFDDGYNLSPARQVEMVYALGYRKYWTKYLGMSHYFNGRTAWQDKVTGEVIAPGRTSDIHVMFAGDGAAAAHFVTDFRPHRGMDEYQRKAAELFGVAPGQVVAINGALGSTSADRAAAFDPDDEVFGPDQGLPGGLWWWDLEADEPGPALLNCINRADRTVKPRAVVWAQGQQDFQAIAAPGTRNPRPTVDRTTVATRAVFAYLRAQWGADLPIFIQGIGWIWDDQMSFSPVGTPMYLQAKRNTWGDVVFTWLSYKDDPAGYDYDLEIYHPNRPEEVLRTYRVPGTSVYGGVITFDWSVELNVPVAVEVFGDQYPWGYLRWRVRRTDDPDWVVSAVIEANVPEDNTAFVKKLCLLGINSLAGGYFNDLSDTLNPGGTGRPGRKDVVAAATFRNTLAEKAGLRPVEVMPIMTVVGSSPINPMPYQAGFPLDNYWWDPDTDQPGPNLLMADGIVKSLGRAPDYFIESGPGETTGIAFAEPADRPAILAAWRTSNIAMLAWMRANWGNEFLEIWFQGASTSWWGTPPPAEANALGARLLRDLQTSMSLENIGFKMGSYVVEGNKWQSYRDEMADGIGWVHYSERIYHLTAAEMATSIALNDNQATKPPVWSQLRQPEGLKAVKAANGDMEVTWTARPGFDRWYFSNLRGDTQAVISQGELAVPKFVFTVAQQVAAYGAPSDYLIFDISEYVPTGALIGPATRFEGFPGGAGDLEAVANLQSTRQLNDDVVSTWTARAGVNDFYYRNIHATTQEVISEGPITGSSYNFTADMQRAAYGFTVAYSHFLVAEYRPSTGETGPFSVWNQDAIAPSNPLAPITGFEAVKRPNGDIVTTWNASATSGRRYRVRNKRADNAAVFEDRIVTSPTYTFTQAEQLAEYGYTVSYLSLDVMEYDQGADVNGPIYSFNGAPST